MAASLLRRQCPCRIITKSVTNRRTFANSAFRPAAYGFIGLGRMGFPMARNLRSKIHKDDTLVIYDVNTTATEDFVKDLGKEGVKTTVAADVAQVAGESETVILSLPEPSHVKSVFESILSSSTVKLAKTTSPTRLFIDCSTIDPITSRAIAAQVTSANIGAFVDAPMSGGVVGASAGTLTFMLGAPTNLVPRVIEVLNMMGRRVVHLGDQGAGLCGKLANNYLLALNNIATAEAMSMGIKWGLDAKALAGMINTSTGRCWPSEVNNPVPGVVETAPAGRDYEGGFGISLMRKDLGLALESAKEFGVKLGLGDRAKEVYDEAAADDRCRGKDFSSVYRWLDGPEK